MKIILTPEAHAFIEEVTRRCPGEVGGMGYCHLDEHENIIVTHCFLLPQTVSTGSVDFDDDAIAIAVERAAMEGKIEELRFSFHSHGGLDTYWSKTDDDGIRKYLSGGTPWLVSLVTNHEGNLLGRVDVANVAIAGVAQFRDVKVEYQIPDRTNGRAAAEIAEYVRERPVVSKGWKQQPNEPRWKREERETSSKSIHEMTEAEWQAWMNNDDPLLGDGVFTG